MKPRPIPVLGGSYDDDSTEWSSQDTINWIPEVAQVEGTRTPTKFRSAPGLKPFVDIGVTGALRGAHNVEEKLFVLSGSRLYQISNTGVAIPIGTIPGSGRVSMAHNQVAGGNELLVVNGSAGYVYNTATSTFQKVTDSGYPGASIVDFVDQFLVQVEPAGRYWFWSDLADALSYSSIDRASAEADPDRIVSLAVLEKTVVVFGRKTTEYFTNTGGATGTFQAERPVTDYGCAGRHTVVKMDSSLILLDHTGRLVRLEGYGFMPISTVPFEQAIAGEDWANAFAFGYESEGHKIYYITFPSGKTYGFDVTTRLFHRRKSYGLDRWRVNTLTYWNRKWIAGDFQQPRLYEVDWDYMLEGTDQPLVSERITGVAHANGNRLEIPYLELLFDAGQRQTVPVEFPLQPQGPTISGDAPDWTMGIDYPGYAYTVTPGDAPIVSVEVHSGTLPVGLSMNNAGVIDTGMPTVVAEYPYAVRAVDSNGLWAEVDDSIEIAPAYWNGADATDEVDHGVTLTNATRDAEGWNTNDTTELPVGVRAVIGRDGEAPRQFEIEIIRLENGPLCGIKASSGDLTVDGGAALNDAYLLDTSIKVGITSTDFLPGLVEGDIVGVFISNRKMWFQRNGEWVYTNPTDSPNGTFDTQLVVATYMPYARMHMPSNSVEEDGPKVRLRIYDGELEYPLEGWTPWGTELE